MDVLGQLGREQLQRHLAVEREIVGAVNNTHTTTTEQRLDPVARELGTGGNLRRRGIQVTPPPEPIASRHAPPFHPRIRSPTRNAPASGRAWRKQLSTH